MREAYRDKAIVLLDLDDTILDFGRAEAAAIRQAFAELGIDAGEKTVARYSEINKAHWEMLERGELTRAQVLVGRFRALFREMGVSVSPELAQKKYEGYLSVGHYFMPGAEELLQTLYGRDRLFLLSNGNASVQAGRLASAGISGYFEKIFISENVGFNKPSVQFFEACFREIPDFRRERAIMIGDSLSSDILGGINAGVKTCWYNPKGKAGREDIRADFEISELWQAERIIEKVIRQDSTKTEG